MAFDFLVPVEAKVLAHNELLSPQALGKNINIHTEKKGLPALENAGVAILAVKESRNAFEKKIEKLNVSAIRLQLYKLMKGNWATNIIDLGDIEEGETVDDTYFLVQKIIAELLRAQIIPIVIGATQDITYPVYRAFDGIQDMINIVSVDNRFDFGMDDELISSHSYMSKIITEKPNNLFNFSNLGYQSYFIAPEEMDLMDRLFFDAYRLGEISKDITLAEPVLRNAHMVSFDARAVRSAELGYADNFSPNGLDGKEICAISRYAGLSEKVMAFGLYEIENTNQSFQLMAQIIWYFIEGLNFRVNEKPQVENNDYTKYIVPTETEQLVFLKSLISQRWWVEVPSVLAGHTNEDMPTLLPCSEKDYLDACNQNIPERWYQAYKKGFN